MNQNGQRTLWKGRERERERERENIEEVETQRELSSDRRVIGKGQTPSQK